MALDLYNMGPRVRYGDFVEATTGLVRGVIQTYGKGNAGQSITLELGMFSGNTAAVSCVRDAYQRLTEIKLSMPAHLPDTIVSGDFAKTLLGFLTHEIGHVMLTDTQETGKAKHMTGDKAGADFINVEEDYFIEYKIPDPKMPMLGNGGALLGRLNDEVQSGADVSMFEARNAKRYSQQGFLMLLTSLNRKGRQGNAMAALHAYCRSQCHPAALAIVDKLMDDLDALADGHSPIECVRSSKLRGELGVAAWLELRKLDVNPPEGDGGAEGDKPQGPAVSPQLTVDGRRAGTLISKDPNSSPAEQAAAQALSHMIFGQRVEGRPDAPVSYGRSVRAQDLARQANVAMLADAARRALRSQDTNTTARRLSVGRMDRRAIVRAAMGAPDVFQRRSFTTGVRTAVMLMIDMSTSMDSEVQFAGQSYSRALVSVAMASAIVPALERAQVEVGVGLFASGLSGNRSVVPVKRFGKRMPQVEQLASAAAYTPWGGTPMLAPALWAEQQLAAQRNATRRVVIWLCDGTPDESSDALHAFVTRRGNQIEHVGLGLDCDLSECFDQHAQVTSMGDLPNAIMRALI